MDSKNGDERESIISYNAFFNNVHGGIIPPPPPPAWASATNDDAVIPRDVEIAAVTDRPLDASAITRLPSCERLVDEEEPRMIMLHFRQR